MAIKNRTVSLLLGTTSLPALRGQSARWEGGGGGGANVPGQISSQCEYLYSPIHMSHIEARQLYVRLTIHIHADLMHKTMNFVI